MGHRVFDVVVFIFLGYSLWAFGCMMGEWLMGIFSKKEDKCLVCEAHLGRINDLKVEISRLVKERDSERAEYKRAIDVILYKQQTPPIGQGVIEPQTHIDPMKALAFFEEETQKDK